MRIARIRVALLACLVGLVGFGGEIRVLAAEPATESKAEHDRRLGWWRDARFGMFIHWGLYSVPAGQWKGKTTFGEWIRNEGQIPLADYEKFVGQFNPVKFNADQWVAIAKNAGAKYIVITTKHHDGFCLFDSKQTDFDIMSTPFQRDIMKEMAEACHRQGIHICWYHSIMDWHHPDYLPRRPWEKRSAEGADFDRYSAYLKNQLRELVTHYGKIGVLWFDGEWEPTWTHDRGEDLYKYVRGLDPEIIVNNRVDKGRKGMEGLNKEGEFAGDFGTPEQEIPARGLPGIDWETCMTMNDHWGFNKNDQHWKSKEDLIRKLADIASKGGNFLLNVGPTSEGLIPAPSVERLDAIGQWMKVNSDSIYGTTASPFKKLDWGRCTQKLLPAGHTRLYLHVFDWPKDGKLAVPGLKNKVVKAFLLADAAQAALPVSVPTGVILTLPLAASDPVDTVIVLDIEGRPDVAAATPR
jgi:alpha-L-fucosidase